MAVSWPHHDRDTVADLVTNISGLDTTLHDKVWDAVEAWASGASEEDRAWLREKIRVSSFSRRAVKRRGKKGHVADRAAAVFQALEPKGTLNRHEWLFRNAWVAARSRSDSASGDKIGNHSPNVRARRFVFSNEIPLVLGKASS